MHFRQVRARNFRLLKNLALELHPKFNFVIGGNGAGKTTILEALYVLGRANSYRGSAQTLVSDGQSTWALEAQQRNADETAPGNKILVRWADRQVSVQINERAVALIELVRAVPVLVLDPLVQRLIEEGPGIRRRYVDWGVFHMEQRFHQVWLRVNRTLKQRNAGLRARVPPRALTGWNRELAKAAVELTAMRQSYIDAVQAVAATYWLRLIGDTDWRLSFHPGWRGGSDYLEVLEANYESDLKAGYTREGPHRAELLVLSDNRQLRDRISRGQQKLLIAGLVLAQCELYRRTHVSSPLLLVDDFAAELSADSQRRLLNELENYPGQKAVAALEYSELLENTANHSMFHVEHGQLTITRTK